MSDEAGIDLELPQQAVFVPLARGEDMLVIMLKLTKGPDGEVTVSRPYLDDIETAALGLAGRNYSLNEED